jgi:galactokinase
MNGHALLQFINSSKAGEIFGSLYGSGDIENARGRYRKLVEGMLQFGAVPVTGPGGRVIQDFPELQGNLRVFSAPGRTELGGNHTDHNRGKVLAASIHLDVVAIVAPRADRLVIFRSTGYPDVTVDLSDLAPRREERGAPEALVRGIGAAFSARGVTVGGFTANADSTVLAGSGLSSSAALEVLFGRIFDNLYGGGSASALEIARIGQRAENDYFGKPSGLMDQLACATGGAAAIDFKDAENPIIAQINLNLASMGYILCVVNTRGSHADLLDDYAAIPREMKEVAQFFGKTVLRELNQSTIMEQAAEIRKKLGDRALLRALHFFGENRRVEDMQEALEKADTIFDLQERQGAVGHFLKLVTDSGNSSCHLLQNIYSPGNPREQGISLALALTRNFLPRTGACRVHGGGFAGTIQAYIPLVSLDSYREDMGAVFGAGAVTLLQIRRIGSVELVF